MKKLDHGQPTVGMALYYSEFCGFCARVRRTIADLGLQIELRDVVSVPAHRTDLVGGGGKATVPCLRIEHADGKVEWMYESADISRYLTENFAR